MYVSALYSCASCSIKEMLWCSDYVPGEVSGAGVSSGAYDHLIGEI